MVFLLVRCERELDGGLGFEIRLLGTLQGETDEGFPVNRGVLADVKRGSEHGDTMIDVRRRSGQEW